MLIILHDKSTEFSVNLRKSNSFLLLEKGKSRLLVLEHSEGLSPLGGMEGVLYLWGIPNHKMDAPMAKDKTKREDDKPTKSTVNIPADLNRQIEAHIEETGQTKQGFFIWLLRNFFREQKEKEV